MMIDRTILCVPQFYNFVFLLVKDPKIVTIPLMLVAASKILNLML